MIYKSTSLKQVICKYTFPYIAEDGNDYYVMGTAIMITPGLALTARHVVESVFETFTGRKIENSNGEQHYEIPCRQYLTQIINGEKAFRWNIVMSFLSQFSDIAFLQLFPSWSPPPDPKSTKGIRIDLHCPEIGEEIVAFGYPKSIIKKSEREVIIRLDPRTSTGNIVEKHESGRDKILWFPVVRVNAKFDSGMSGGPVFNKKGKLVGLVCRSMSMPIEENDYISYFSLLWPSFATKITLDRENHEHGEEYLVLDLAKEGIIDAIGHENIVIGNENDVFWCEQNP